MQFDGLLRTMQLVNGKPWITFFLFKNGVHFHIGTESAVNIFSLFNLVETKKWTDSMGTERSIFKAVK